MSRVSYKSESQEKMEQTIKLLNFQYSKFDQPEAIELQCVWKIEEHLETCKNVKLISYRQYPFDIPQSAKKIEEVIQIPMCIGMPIYHYVTLQDIDGRQYKRPYNCIFVLCVFLIIWGIYAYCFYHSYSSSQ